MPIASSITDAALQHLNVLRVGGVARPADSVRCLEAMKSILDAWQVEPATVVGLQKLTYTPSAGTQSFTIGPSGNVVASQPLRIESNSYYRVNGVDTPIGVGTMDDYNAQADKAATGSPDFVALNRGYDTATVYIYPAADGVSQLNLFVQVDPVSSFSSIALSTSLALPAGMRRALEWAIAKEVMTGYQVDPQTRADVVANAANTLRTFKRSNTRIGRLQMPVGIPGASSYNIETE